jgi:hypothetical protein
MNDLDVRAHSAAAGLRHAVDQFEPITDTSAPVRRYRGSRVVLALLALVLVSAVGAVLAAWLRDDDTSVRTVDEPPVTATTSTFVGGYPIAITVDDRGAFVTNQQEEVVRLDRTTGAIAARVPTERRIYGVATDPELGIWAWGGGDGADGTGDLVFLGPATDRPPTTLHLEDGVLSLVLAAGRVWTVDTGGNLIARDPRTLQVILQTNVPSAEDGHTLAADDERLWVATHTSLYAFDPTDPGPSGFGVNPGPLRGASPPIVELTGTESFRSLASDGRWLWDSVCTDEQSERCFLERRDPETGALVERDNRALATRYSGSGIGAGIHAADGSVWAIAADGPSLLRTTPSGRVERVMTIPPRLRSDGTVDEFRYFGIGAGALWYSVPEAGEIYRIPLP